MEPEDQLSSLPRLSFHNSTSEAEDDNPLGYDRAILKEFIEFRNKNFKKKDNDQYQIESVLQNKIEIIKKIPCPFYIPILLEEPAVAAKLLRFIQAYPTDAELEAMYARSLEKSSLGVSPYVLDWLARAVLTAYGDETETRHFFLQFYTYEYLDKLSGIQWQKINLTPHLRNISAFCHEKDGFIRHNKINFKNKTHNTIAMEKIFIEECDYVLSFLNSMPKKLSQICSYESENPYAWFDAFFIFLINELSQSGNEFIIKKLSYFLYNKEEITNNPPSSICSYAHYPSLKLTYAKYYLGSEKKYEEAVSLYQFVLDFDKKVDEDAPEDVDEVVDEKGHGFFHTAEHYQALSGFL